MNHFFSSGLVTGMILLMANGCRTPSDAPPQKQNVVIILTDDMGYGNVSTYGYEANQTPNIDQIAKEGALFTDFYVPVPYCAPSRASLLTGRFPLRHGMVINPHPDIGVRNDTVGLAASEITLGEALQEAGYKTKVVGKWHLGHKPRFFPTNNGFDEYYGILYSNDMLPIQLIENMDTVEYPVDQRLLTKKYTEKAIDFIQRHQEEPFFLHLCHAMPHKPLAASEDFYTPETPDNLYDDVIRELDWSVGEVMATLERLDLLDNTIVIFMSDNGGSWGGSTGGLKGRKARTWEGGTRVPFMIRGSNIPADVTIHTPAWSIDLFPTLLSMLDIEPPEVTLDGIDITGIIQGTRTTHPPIFSLRNDRVMTIRSGDWKLFLQEPGYYTGPNKNYNAGWLAKQPNDSTIIAQAEQPTPDEYPGIKPMPFDTFPLLFNLREDVVEMENLAGQYPEKVEELQGLYEEFMQSLDTDASAL